MTKHETLSTKCSYAWSKSPLNSDHRLVVLELTENFDPATMTLAYLRYIDELTMDEMAEVTGLSRKTVSKKLARFERKARSRLADTTAEARS